MKGVNEKNHKVMGENFQDVFQVTVHKDEH